MDLKLNYLQKSFFIKIIINISFFYFSYNLIASSGSVYELKKTLTFYFLIFLISLIISANSVLRTKIYLALSSLGLALLQISEFSYFSNILGKDFCIIFAFASILCTGPFRVLKNTSSEHFLDFISVLCPYVAFIIFNSLIHDYQIILSYFILTCAICVFISIWRREKISAQALSEILAAYLLLLHSVKSISPEVTLYYISFFAFISITYLYLINSSLEPEYKKTMNFIAPFLPLLVNIGNIEAFVVFVLLFNLTASKYFYNLKDLLILSSRFLKERYHKFISYQHFPNMAFGNIPLPRFNISVTISLFFAILFIVVLF